MREKDEIMPATEQDRSELLALYRAQLGREFCAWDEDYPGNETIDFDLSRDSLFVMKREGRIIAAISLEEDADVDALSCWDQGLAPGGEMARLCVLPELQNEGLARDMMRYGIEELKKRGYKSIHFLVSQNNIKAIRSYAVFGYEVVGKCHMYDQDFLCYEKALQQL